MTAPGGRGSGNTVTAIAASRVLTDTWCANGRRRGRNNRLGSPGLIERHASPGDRRGMIVRATQYRKTNYAMREAAEMIRAILRDAQHSTG
jgi:hypothetical protein